MAPGSSRSASRSDHRGSVAGRASWTQTVHVEDLARRPRGPEFPLGRAIAVQFGHRTTLATPLLREGVPIGASSFAAARCGRSRTREIALLQTFADQAVIAIENVRLFTELRRATPSSPRPSRGRPRRARCCASSPRSDRRPAGLRHDRGERSRLCSAPTAPCAFRRGVIQLGRPPTSTPKAPRRPACLSVACRPRAPSRAGRSERAPSCRSRTCSRIQATGSSASYSPWASGAF